jgi:glycine/D-amino acid oxidase-like deaminating enzyme
MPEEKNYWLTTVKMPAPPAQSLPTTADVAIIGAGFTGLSAALALAKRGAKVVVLEAETIGWGASSRNGGMVLTGLKLGVDKLIASYGRELTRRMYAASLESIDVVERLIKEEHIACDFTRTGHLEVACKAAHFDDYSRQVEVIARDFNHQMRVVPSDQLRSEIGSDIYYGGMVDEVSAGLNPARYVAGLASAATRAGAQILERTRLQIILREPQNGAPGFKLKTSRGSIRARNVLIGTS